MSDKNIDQLKDALNIDREPFSEEGVVGLFFPGAGRQALLEQLMHLCRYGSPLLFLVGENGVGKSTLVAQLESRIDPAVYRLVYIDADVLADEHFLLAQLAEGFSLDLGEDSEAAINALVRFSKEVDSYSQTPLLLLDSAQNLSPDAILFLQALLSHVGGSGFRCMLVSDGESAVKLPLYSSLVGSGVDYQEINVPLLEKAECCEYLAYRMTTSGLGSIQFNADQIDQIYNSSMGNIDKINIIARQLLVATFPYKKNKSKPFKIPLMHLSLALVLAFLLLVSYLFIPPQDTRDVSDLKEASSESVVVSIESKEDVIESVSIDEVSAGETKKLAEDIDGAAIAENALDSFSEARSNVDYNFEEASSGDVLQPLVEVKSKPLKRMEEAKAVQKTFVAAKVKVESPNVSKPVEAKKLAYKPAHVAKTPALTQREKWLMSLDKGKFTLQMLGAREEASVQKFLAKYPSLKGIAYYKTTHKRRDWYVVVYGLYPSKEGAKADLSTLPKSLQQSQPWARSIASIQDEIRKRKN